MTITRKTVAEIDSAIAGIRTNGAAFERTVHECAVQCLILVAEHGDWTKGADLLNAVPKGMRREGLSLWFTHFSNKKLRFQLDKDSQLYRGRLDTDRAVADFDVEGANETTFADLTSEPKVSTLTLEKFIASVERVANNTKKNADGTAKVDETTRATAAFLVAQYRGKQKAAIQQAA